jgi:hypothetical protein
MDRLRRKRDITEAGWQVCLRCGNRYEAANHGYKVNWCSRACEDADWKRQREEIETTWLRARWFLR